MANTLDLTGLNGLQIDKTQFVAVGAGAQTMGDVTTAITTSNKSADFFGALSPSAVLTINYHAFTPGQITANGAVFSIGLQASPSKKSHYAIPQEFDKVVGWNADSILIHNPSNSAGYFNYIIISSKHLANAVLDNSTFTTTGPAPTFTTASGGTITPAIVPAVCFAAGTRIATAFGTAAVEHIRMGDLIRTVSGALQPVIWVGQRTIDAASHPQPARVMPIHVAPGAFGPGMPSRTLVLSPEHAVFADGAMVPVHRLVNGATIRQVPVDTVTYHHIELPRHDALFAEGLPAESYLDTGNRAALYGPAHTAATA